MYLVWKAIIFQILSCIQSMSHIPTIAVGIITAEPMIPQTLIKLIKAISNQLRLLKGD